ncbi:hypothetical protein BN1708_002768 [Verticillium longisporum]|uniref:NADP-dependent oxidoreductase domain-containing protein n=1 Tax=Verticillium longisporum TaxID=100787 RepID=A0A0G4L0J9_VERLO|nr:hypothetical protein BN1708_002768 [Verticillium longisporum]
MSSGRSFKLNSGHSIPAVGLGTWQSGPNEVARAVEHALRHGYRHIDAAAVYDNEEEVGAGIKASGVPREEIFLTSKLWNTHHKAEDVEEALDQSLADLGTDYVDLYLIHWPVSFSKPAEKKQRFPLAADGGVDVIDVPASETWKAMEALVKKGKIRSIGVSNFSRARIEDLLKNAEIKPAVNQIEAHPYLQQPELLEWSKQQDILITAYSPSGNNIYNLPKALDDPEVAAIAKELNSGHSIPAVGLGTWQSGPNEVARAVEHALRHGYRHIDAAAVYDNEEEVGAGIKASGVPRKEIFLTSKLWNTHHKAEDVEEALDQSLADLGTDYVDLYLIHWPVSFSKPAEKKQRFPLAADGGVDVIDVPASETWKAMEALVKKGKIRSIGVSNFSKARIEDLLKTAEIKPAVNQIEAHPYLQQPELLEWSKQQDILITAYSPSGNNIYNLPKALDDPEVAAIAKEVGRQPAQVLIQWAVQRGTVVLPKSVTPSRIEENFQDFELPAAALERINKLDKNHRYNMPARLGVDVFGEHDEAFLKKARADWIAAQKAAK